MTVSDFIFDIFALALAIVTLFYECSMPISFLALDVLASAVQTAILYSSPDLSRVLRIVNNPSKLLRTIPRPSHLLGSSFLPTGQGMKKVELSVEKLPNFQQVSSDAAKELSRGLPEQSKIVLPASALAHSQSVVVNDIKLKDGVLDLSNAPQVPSTANLGLSALQIPANGPVLQSKSRESDGTDLVENESTLRISCNVSDMGNASSTHAYIPHDKPPATILEIKCHPEVEDVCARVDGFFLENWPFPTQQDKNNYTSSELCRWACYALPGSRSDRVDDACKVNILLFLLDDVAENMSLEEGKAMYQKLVPLAMGTAQPDRGDPIQWITYDIWASMRAIDEKRTQDVFQTALLCIMAQVDSARTSCTDIGSLLRQREKEGGCGFVEAVMRWSMCLTIEPEIYQSFRPILALYAKHGIGVNDIESYEKEMAAWNKDHKEGGRVLNIVHLFSHDTGLMPEASKRVIYILAREWEIDFFRMVEEHLNKHSLNDNEDVKMFVKGLEWILAGNEHWSVFTGRYHGAKQ